LFRCQSSDDRYSQRETVSVVWRLCYCYAGSDTWPMIDIRFAVWL
ncbi:hypothetical protein T07_7389, partial [Trichinella nelsoni]